MTLQPIKNNHSVKKVKATVFMPQAVPKPEDYFNEIKEQFSSYQKTSIIASRTFTFQNNPEPESSKIIKKGFVMEEFQDGSLKNYLAFENISESQSAISFESRMYGRWAQFKEKFLTDIAVLTENKEFYIQAISLEYLDEFRWVSEEEIDVNSIFRLDSDYLTQHFLKSKNSNLISVTQEEVDSGFNKEEVSEISFNNKLDSITINHKILFRFNEFHNLDFSQDNKFIETHFQKAHEQNKLFLKEILTQKTLTLIKLT